VPVDTNTKVDVKVTLTAATVSLM